MGMLMISIRWMGWRDFEGGGGWDVLWCQAAFWLRSNEWRRCVDVGFVSALCSGVCMLARWYAQSFRWD